MVLEESASNQDILGSKLDQAYQELAALLLSAYQGATTKSRLLPEDEQDLQRLLRTFLIEKAMQELRYDLNARPQQAHIAIRGLLQLI